MEHENPRFLRSQNACDHVCLSGTFSGIVARVVPIFAGVRGGLGRASIVWQADETMTGGGLSFTMDSPSTLRAFNDRLEAGRTCSSGSASGEMRPSSTSSGFTKLHLPLNRPGLLVGLEQTVAEYLILSLGRVKTDLQLFDVIRANLEIPSQRQNLRD
ncbi:hypothetical protein KCU88_g191, partial [Aureobasidium melanogenum]